MTRHHVRHRAGLLAISSGAVLAALLVGSGGPADAAPAVPAAPAAAYRFLTLNNQRDVTFNQLLGINRRGVIAGYFGSGTAGHPNQGYTLTPRYGQNDYQNENFPGAVQTQVTGLNDRGVTVGFWSSMNNTNQINDNFGFWARGGHFHTVRFPTTSNATPPVNQLLGVNDHDRAVGFYTDAAGNNHGYTYGLRSHRFVVVTVPGATSVTAAAINNSGDVAGFFTDAAGTTVGFFKDDGVITDLAVPGASMTQPFGVNDHDEVVGAYQVGTGAAAATHGFTWTRRFGFITVDDPNGVGATTVNGVNNSGDVVGFYTDGAGNVDGMLAKPIRVAATVRLTPQPVGTVALARSSNGTVAAALAISGLAPGVTHSLDIQSGSCNALRPAAVQFPPVSANGNGQLLTHITSTGSLPELRTAALMIRLGNDQGDPTASLPVACVNLGRWTGTPIAGPVIALSDQRGRVQGWAAVGYDGATQTLTVRVVVSGLAPYTQHAIHLHAGTCVVQGSVIKGLPDLVADRFGVAAENLTLTGITTPPSGPAYLNVHLGAMSQILTPAGQPTMLFQPLSCGDLHMS